MPHDPPIHQDRADPSHLADALAAEALPTVADDEIDDDILGESAPEHGWLGHGFVWAVYAMVPVQLVSGLYLLAPGPGPETGPIPPFFLLYLFFPLVFLWLARSIQTFRLQGWGVAMLGVLGMALSSLGLLLGNPDGLETLAGLGTGALAIAWIRYFWNRLPDFT